MPNAPAEVRRAESVEFGTEAESRRRLQPVCSAISYNPPSPGETPTQPADNPNKGRNCHNEKTQAREKQRWVRLEIRMKRGVLPSLHDANIPKDARGAHNSAHDDTEQGPLTFHTQVSAEQLCEQRNRWDIDLHGPTLI